MINRGKLKNLSEEEKKAFYKERANKAIATRWKNSTGISTKTSVSSDVSKPIKEEKTMFKFKSKESSATTTNTSWKYLPNKELEDILSYEVDQRNNVLLVGPVGSGKCLGYDTPVLMFNGDVKPVQEIKENDLLMGPDSLPRKVQSLHRSKGSMYEIKPVKGDSWKCNDVHVLTLKKTPQHKGDKENIIDIPLNTYLKQSKYKQDSYKLFRVGINFSHTNHLELDPYFLGLWLGDGTRKKTEITNSNKVIINYLKEWADANGYKMNLYDNTEGKAPRWNFIKNKGKHGNPLRQFIRVFDDKKFIPFNYKTSSRKNRLKLLAGLLDTDGHLIHNGFEIVTKYEELKNDILYLARSLGLAAYSSNKFVQLKGWNEPKKYYRISISGNTYEIPSLLKKANKRKQKKDALKTGFKTISIGNDNYYGFELDGDGRFLLGDFTVTHNTSSIEDLAKRRGVNVVRVNLNQQTTLNDFLGTWVAKGGETLWVDGVLPTAMKTGSWIILDEIDYGDASILSGLNAVLELGKPLILKEKDGEAIYPLGSFRIFATANTLGCEAKYKKHYTGTNNLNMAFLDRFSVHQVAWPSIKKECSILKANFNLKEEEIIKLTTIADSLRTSFLKGELQTAVSPRRVYDIARRMEHGATMIASFRSAFKARINEENFKIIEGVVSRYVVEVPVTNPNNGITVTINEKTIF